MKKIIITLLICAMPSLAFAVTPGETYTSEPGATITGQIDADSTALRIHTLSNNVVANIIWSTTQYLTWTHHNSGTKYYGAVTDRTKLYWTERAADDFDAPTTSASDTFETAGWASF